MSVEPTLLPLDEVQGVAPPSAAAGAGDRRSLYRAYRSLTFGEVAGQQHVTHTLRNAVRTGTVAHAYLFTGPRGTGKTSTARILARAVNCLQPRDGEPCNGCSICVSMLERRALDLVEIDGASNNSVDDVRELRERVNFRPAEARRKVFIIDEVHMLSIGAFNALLKTLEEPPEHILFLLATTELHKVPATVSSRCQIFTLRPIPAPEVVERLRYVCEQEGMQADLDVLRFITAQSTGSLRDALSLLEQIRAYCGDVLIQADVEAVLGVARVGQVGALADAMAGGDVGAALLATGDLAESGIDPRQLARQLAGYWREALLGRARREPPAEPHVAACSADQIALVLRYLLNVELHTRRSDSPRWALELAITEATLALGGSAASRGAPLLPQEATDQPAPPPVVQGGQIEEPAAPAATAADCSVVGPDTAVPDGGIGDPGGPAIERVRERWPEVMRWLSVQQKGRVYGLLKFAAVPVMALDGSRLTIGFPPNHGLTIQQLVRPNNRQVVEQALVAVLGGQWRVECATIETMPVPPSMDRLGDLDYLDSFAAEVSARERRRPNGGDG